jgi:hypothetical protein
VRAGVGDRKRKVKLVWKQARSLAGKNLRRERSETLNEPKREVFRLPLTSCCKI